MILDKNHKDFTKLELRDCAGQAIPWVMAWNTETETAQMILMGSAKKSVRTTDGFVTFSIKIPGAKLYWRNTKDVYDGSTSLMRKVRSVMSKLWSSRRG